MGPEDFLTDTEETAFNDVEHSATSGDRHQDNKDIWFAARDYFTQGQDETTEAGLPNGYFDEHRTQVRLQILNFTGSNTEKAKEIEAWVLGEK